MLQSVEIMIEILESRVHYYLIVLCVHTARDDPRYPAKPCRAKELASAAAMSESLNFLIRDPLETM